MIETFYPKNKIDNKSDEIKWVYQDHEELGVSFKKMQIRVTGNHVWVLWETSIGNRLHLYQVLLDREQNTWYCTRETEEKNFSIYNCPKRFLEKSEDNPTIDLEWRKNNLESISIKLWQSMVKEHFSKRKRTTKISKRRRLVVYLKGLWSKRAGKSEEIPYAEITNMEPLIGKYKNRYYRIKKEAVVDCEVILLKHPRGLKESLLKKYKKDES